MPIKILQTVAKVENSAQYCAKLKEKKAYVFVKFFASHGGGQSYTSQVLFINTRRNLLITAIWANKKWDGF